MPSPVLDKDLFTRLSSSYRWDSDKYLNFDLRLGSISIYFIVTSASVTFGFILRIVYFLSVKYVMEDSLVLYQSRRWKLCGLAKNRGNKYCKVQSSISIWYVVYGCILILGFVIGIAFKLKCKLFLWWKETVAWLACCSRTKKQLLF